jgi:hypothetical protein
MAIGYWLHGCLKRQIESHWAASPLLNATITQESFLLSEFKKHMQVITGLRVTTVRAQIREHGVGSHQQK